MVMFEQELYAVATKGASIGKTRSPLHDVDEAFDLVRELAARVESLAERMVGDVPEDAVQRDRVSSGCGGVLGATADTASQVRERIVSAMRALDRIAVYLP